MCIGAEGEQTYENERQRLTYPALAHSLRMASVSLLVGNDCAIVLGWRKVGIVEPVSDCCIFYYVNLVEDAHGSEKIRASGLLGERVGRNEFWRVLGKEGFRN